MRDTHTIANSLKERNSLSVEQVFALSGSKRKPTKKADYRAPVRAMSFAQSPRLGTRGSLGIQRTA